MEKLLIFLWEFGTEYLWFWENDFDFPKELGLASCDELAKPNLAPQINVNSTYLYSQLEFLKPIHNLSLIKVQMFITQSLLVFFVSAGWLSYTFVDAQSCMLSASFQTCIIAAEENRVINCDPLQNSNPSQYSSCLCQIANSKT